MPLKHKGDRAHVHLAISRVHFNHHSLVAELHDDLDPDGSKKPLDHV